MREVPWSIGRLGEQARDYFLERCAILEYEAGFERLTAESMAIKMTLEWAAKEAKP